MPLLCHRPKPIILGLALAKGSPSLLASDNKIDGGKVLVVAFCVS